MLPEGQVRKWLIFRTSRRKPSFRIVPEQLMWSDQLINSLTTGYHSPRGIVVSGSPPARVTRGPQRVRKAPRPLNVTAQTWLFSPRNHWRLWRSLVKPFIPGINTPWDRRSVIHNCCLYFWTWKKFLWLKIPRSKITEPVICCCPGRKRSVLHFYRIFNTQIKSMLCNGLPSWVGCQSSNATLIKLNVCFITFICLHARFTPSPRWAVSCNVKLITVKLVHSILWSTPPRSKNQIAWLITSWECPLH